MKTLTMRLEDIDQKQRGIRNVDIISGGLSLLVEGGRGESGGGGG